MTSKGRPKLMKSGARKRSIKISNDLDTKIENEIETTGMLSHSEFLRFVSNVYFHVKTINSDFWDAYINDINFRR